MWSKWLKALESTEVTKSPRQLGHPALQTRKKTKECYLSSVHHRQCVSGIPCQYFAKHQTHFLRTKDKLRDKIIVFCLGTKELLLYMQKGLICGELLLIAEPFKILLVPADNSLVLHQKGTG
jgi:hypothetical protein